MILYLKISQVYCERSLNYIKKKENARNSNKFSEQCTGKSQGDKEVNKKAPLSVDKLVELAEFDLTSSWFKFKWNLYPNSWCSMGKPASSIDNF